MEYINHSKIMPLNICIIIFLILQIIIPIRSKSTNYIKLPLKITGFPSSEELSSISAENLVLILSNIRVQTDITLGSNKQVLPADISFEHYPLYISSILCEEKIPKFNHYQSRSFINYDKIDGSNINQNCLKCNTTKDIFYFDNNKEIPLNFILGYLLSFKHNTISAEIGFKPTKTKTEPSALNILLQLKKQNFISYKNFMLYFNSKNNIMGDLFLGAFPDKFYKNYQKFKYFYISAENGDIQYWQFMLDNAYYGNKYICEKNKVIISLKDYFIYVPFYMKKILDEEFFKELHDNQICDLINLDKTSTYFYVCDDTINIKKMKNFRFYPFNLNEPIEIILSPEDLFIKFGKNKLLYLIAFNYDIDYWKLNLPFILKYQPIFDLDNKIISLYNDINLFNESDFISNDDININNDKNNKDKGDNFFVKLLKGILYFFLITFLVLIILFILKKIYELYRKGKINNKNDEKILEFKDMSYDYKDIKDDNDKIDNNKI